MDAVTALRAEHRAIELVLQCLERLAKRAESTRQTDPDSARPVLEFFGDSVECHFKKEELLLRSVLETKSDFERRSKSFVLSYQAHHQCHVYLETLNGFLKYPQDPHYAIRFARLAMTHVQALRQHMKIEEELLFPFADSLLAEEEHAGLLQAFEELERNRPGKGTTQSVIQAAHELADRFGVCDSEGEHEKST